MPRQSDKYETDEWIRGIFPSTHWYDPCPIDWEEGDPDGLDIDWSMSMYHDALGVFVNPPYSNPKPWIQKAIQEHKKGVTIVLLLKHDSSTEWWRLLHEAGAHFLPIHKRLKHRTGKAANFPSVFAYLWSGNCLYMGGN